MSACILGFLFTADELQGHVQSLATTAPDAYDVEPTADLTHAWKMVLGVRHMLRDRYKDLEHSSGKVWFHLQCVYSLVSAVI